MIRNLVVYLLSSLFCLSLVACGTFEVGRQQAPAVGQVEAAENTALIVKETGASSTVTSTAEAVFSDTAVLATETAVTAETDLEVDTAEGAVYAKKGTETVALPACYDFDAGASVVPPDNACDFSMLPGPDRGTIEVYPQAGAELAYDGVFSEVPTLAQCTASAAFSREREIVAPLAAMYVCYRTGEGRTGYLHFTAADLEQAGTLTFGWVTFATEEDAGSDPPGQVLTYRDETFGFELALPPTWTGFSTTQHDQENGSSICFTFTGSAPFCVLQIDVWRKAAWSNLETVPEGYYLGENEDFVFAAGPYQAECVQLDDFQCARHREVPAILAGLRVE